MAADDALRCGRAAADAWFSGIRMSAGDSCDIPNSSECAVGCGQYAVRVHAVGFQWFVSVVSDEFLFGADRRLPVSERVGIVAVVGAAKRVPVSGDRIREVDGTQSLSLPHLAAGSMCIAANLGCRPQFILVALLAFVIFWPQIQSIFRHASNDSSLPPYVGLAV